MSGVKVGGVWKTPGTTYAKVGGVWKVVATVSAKVGGAWKVTTLGAPPAAPVFDATSHTAYGQFTVTNYDPNVVYNATLISGTGTCTRVGAVFTVSGTNARWSITTSYAVGAPTSAADFIERKAYTYHTENQQTCSPNCRPISGNCFNGTGSCQGDGSCGADGTICCGGSMGSTCTGDPNAQVRDATPSGYSDSFSEWWKHS